MSTTALVLISVLIGIAILGIAALIFLRKRRTEGLRTRFGPEYTRALQESGDRRQAEASLEERKKRVEHFHLRLHNYQSCR
jgi:LPXTG-motif cell wall-anchored protein